MDCGSNVCTVVQTFVPWFKFKGLHRGLKVCTVVQSFAPLFKGLHCGSDVCTVVQSVELMCKGFGQAASRKKAKSGM
jgi:hypothetical protein